MEALGGQLSRILERLIGAIVNAALVIGGSMLLLAPLRGWLHILGESMVFTGIFGTLLVCIGALRHDRGRR